MKSNDIQIATEYKGVGGWLLIFCLSLTVFSPLFTIVSGVSNYRDVSPYFDQFPGLMNVTIIDRVLATGLTIFSIYVGIWLWKVRSGSVKIAKYFLLVCLGYSVLVNLLLFMAGLPPQVNEAMAKGVGDENTKSGSVCSASFGGNVICR